jgi:ABC-type branched-subunit amino acid transport system substrate-binding protein
MKRQAGARWIPAFALMALMAWSSAHAEDGVGPQQLLIGQSITLQGGKNDYGTAVLDGVETYLSRVNKQGGVAGRW